MMQRCSFKRASTEKIISGDWTPFSPRYYPFSDVDFLCTPCFRWQFLTLIRGSFPRWGALLVDPINSDEEFPRYYKVSSDFSKFSVMLMRALSRSVAPDSIIRDISQPGLLLDYLRGSIDPEDHHGFTIELIGILLNRLHSENILNDYIESENILFNLSILNEKFDIYRHDQTRVSLTQNIQSEIGVQRVDQPQTFTWTGPLSIMGTIPIIHLDNQEIRVPVPIAGNFFNPPLDLTNTQTTPQGIYDFFINKEFHKMWILKESLSQLIEDVKISNNILDALGNSLYNSPIDLQSYDFRSFNVILDCIDHSITMNPQLNFKNETGQAAIIYDLLYKAYPTIVNTFQSFDPCPIKIGLGPSRSITCPLDGNMGCGMSDRRITDRQFPRDKIERNVYRFLRYLRDEMVFSHELLYKLTRFYPERIGELNQFSDFWVGTIQRDPNQRWIFHPTMPNYWISPQVSEKVYEICLISPLVYERGYKFRFIDELDNGDFLINPITTFNPWVEELPFSHNTTILCMVGLFSIEESNINIERQKKQLVKAIHFMRSTISNVSPAEQPNMILLRRLSDRGKRVGMATFGSYARYV